MKILVWTEQNDSLLRKPAPSQVLWSQSSAGRQPRAVFIHGILPVPLDLYISSHPPPLANVANALLVAGCSRHLSNCSGACERVQFLDIGFWCSGIPQYNVLCIFVLHGILARGRAVA
jgi:hypothetical protein